MGRILTSVTVDNVLDQDKSIRIDALVDTGATFMVLPSAWKDRLGDFQAAIDMLGHRLVPVKYLDLK